MRAARREDRQRDAGQHEDDRGPDRGFVQRRGSAAGAESGLAAGATESGRDVAAATALQVNDDDEEEANNDVNRRDEIDVPHGFAIPNGRARWCGRGDLKFQVSAISSTYAQPNATGDNEKLLYTTLIMVLKWSWFSTMK